MPRARKPRPISVEVFRSAAQWVGFVTVGAKPNGKPDRRKRAGKTCPTCWPPTNPNPTCRCRAVVETKIRDLEDQAAAGRLAAAGHSPTIQEWITTWLADIAPHSGRRPLRPSTIASYQSDVRNWIIPNIGGIRLPDLTTDHLDRLYTAMRKGGMAPSHVLKVHAILRRALTVAMQRGKVSRNVAQMIDNPGAPTPRRRKALSREQVEQIITVINTRRNALRWKVGLAIGPRQGEALGLAWDQYDPDEGVVDIAWQVQRRTWRHGCVDPHECGWRRDREGQPLHRTTHTCKGAGVRHDLYHKRGCPGPCPPRCTGHASACPQRMGGGLVMVRPKNYVEGETDHKVGLPPTLVAELRVHHQRQGEERQLAGELWQDHGLIFCQPNGRPIDPRQDWAEWRSILAEAGVADAGTHVLRHTAATMLLDLGVDIAVVQEVLGHADVRMTRAYQSVSTQATRAAAKKMDALFRPAKPPKRDSATGPATGDHRRSA